MEAIACVQPPEEKKKKSTIACSNTLSVCRKIVFNTCRKPIKDQPAPRVAAVHSSVFLTHGLTPLQILVTLGGAAQWLALLPHGKKVVI